MTFEEWFEQERKAERLYGADEEVAKVAWTAGQRAMQPPQVYHDSRIAEAIRQQFSQPG